jgi:hypothetical protein
MKNIFDVLRQKEGELQQIQREVEALRVAARLLVDEADQRPEAMMRPAVAVAAAGPVPAPRPKEMAVGYDVNPRQFP